MMGDDTQRAPFWEAEGEASKRLASSGQVLLWKTAKEVPPLFVQNQSDRMKTSADFANWVEANRADLDALLVEHGAIVFRDFPVAETSDFHKLVDVYPAYEGDYRGGATPRDAVQGKVYEATKIDASAKLPLHQEMAYIENAPGRLAFFCRKPAEVGGATTIADMRAVTNNLPASIHSALEEKGVLCVRNFSPPLAPGEEEGLDHPDQRSWEFAFYTKDRAVVEKACSEKQMECIWNQDNSLTVRNRLDAFSSHPTTGERVYRNILHTNAARDMTPDLPPDRRKKLDEMFSRQAMPSGFFLGDGTPLTSKELADLQEVFTLNELAWQWQAGDVMLVDNLLVAHGRNPYEGSRDVQVALLA
ncbi:TauD/TfdA family dioxygenase [Sphingobium fuliginis]|jgi:alpha-ketoglutarate-dependent taurine dioxygenase|uniref:TauD/TfdA family dioxygenase n=1 Tax=Sphingobium fuliginis (strain ATCC 27551) TaxID=336203 RepID=UPI000C087D99|nr:TauD/TfdA family dioxygenase [Sphingobium fuliginis]